MTGMNLFTARNENKNFITISKTQTLPGVLFLKMAAKNDKIKDGYKYFISTNFGHSWNLLQPNMYHEEKNCLWVYLYNKSPPVELRLIKIYLKKEYNTFSKIRDYL